MDLRQVPLAASSGWLSTLDHALRPTTGGLKLWIALTLQVSTCEKSIRKNKYISQILCVCVTVASLMVDPERVLNFLPSRPRTYSVSCWVRTKYHLNWNLYHAETNVIYSVPWLYPT